MQKQVLIHTLSSSAVLHHIPEGQHLRPLGPQRLQLGYSCHSRRQRQIIVQQGKRDPLDADIWDSWQNQEEDWDTEKFTEDELIDILFDVSALLVFQICRKLVCHTAST